MSSDVGMGEGSQILIRFEGGLAPRFLGVLNQHVGIQPQSFISVKLSFTVGLDTYEIPHSYAYFCFKL